MFTRTFLLLLMGILSSAYNPIQTGSIKEQASVVLKKQIWEEAAWAMQQKPITVTAEYSPRSAGGTHDFFSEGDYWWPNPVHPDSPYVQRDGMTNPANFTAHRLAMIRFSRIVGALASAYLLTGDNKYVLQALVHCKAWFTNTATKMNPNLLFAQAIKGRFTGRGIGIIDTIQLIEVVQGLVVMEKSSVMDAALLREIKDWFAQYLGWLTSHPYGKEEMNARNNHGTCWVMQVAAFARFTGNRTLMDFCRNRFTNVLLPEQLERDGSMPLELKRTKPFGYSLFNLDAMATICQLLATPENDLWHYQTKEGKSLQQAMLFMFPFVKDKLTWPYQKDVMYWDAWPVAQPFLLLGANAYGIPAWFTVWKRGEHDPKEPEVIRNLPLRHPLIWL